MSKARAVKESMPLHGAAGVDFATHIVEGLRAGLAISSGPVSTPPASEGSADPGRPA